MNLKTSLAFLTRTVAAAVVWLLLAALAIGLGTLWLVATEAAARWLLPPVAAHFGVTIAGAEVHGALLGPLTVDTASAETASGRVQARQILIDWRLVRWRELEIRRLHIADLRIDARSVTSPSEGLPSSLELPFDLRVLDLRIERFAFGMDGDLIALNRLVGKGEARRDRHRIELVGVESAIGRTSGEISVGARTPFPLGGYLDLERRASAFPLTAQVRIGGDLARVELTGHATLDAGRAQGRVVATPFGRLPLDTIELVAEDIDPAKINARWPQAKLRAQIRARMSGEDRFTGNAELYNAVNGPLDRGRLPVVAIRSAIDGNEARLVLADLLIDLGSGGRLRGRGDWRDGQLELALDGAAIDLAAIESSLRMTRLAGRLGGTVSASRQTMQAELTQDRLSFALDASHARGEVLVRSFKARAGEGTAELQGRIAPGVTRAFEANGKLNRFNPAALGAFPAAMINAGFAARGQLGAPLALEATFEIRDSVYAGRPFEGEGRLLANRERIEAANLMLRAGGNVLEAKGAIGAPDDSIEWRIDAPGLGNLGLGFAGVLIASGQARGTLDAPRLSFKVAGERITAPGGIAIDALGGGGEWNDEVLDARLSLRGARWGAATIDNAEASVQGSPRAHVASLRASGASLDVDASASGALSDRVWRGRIERLRARQPYAIELTAPATVEIALSGEYQRLADIEARVAGGTGTIGTIRIDLLERNGDQLALRGNYRGLELAAVRAMVSRERNELGGDLAVSGEVDLRSGATLNGRVTLRRDRGDLWLLERRDQSFGLTDIEMALTATSGQVQGTLEVGGTRLGRLSAQGATTLSRSKGRWGLAGNAPVRADAILEMRSLAWLVSSIVSDAEVDGQLSGRVEVRGTVASPQLAGRLEGSGLRVGIPSQDLLVRDGEVAISFAGEDAKIERARFAGRSGTVQASGAIGFAGGRPEGRIRIELDRLDAIADPDRQAVLSGVLVAAIRDRRIDVTGDLVADRGLIRLVEADLVKSSDDVVVIGRSGTRPSVNSAKSVNSRSDPGRARDPTRTTAIVDVGFDLGEQFRLRGRGLDARLAGKLRIQTNEAATIRVTGAVRSVEGTYKAYGQSLTIERGVVTFGGALDNPALNVLAVRKGLPVEAGVLISGFALQPRVVLSSTPVVSDAEKLSWLVLGHGIDAASGGDFGVLGAAAGALLSPGDSAPLQSRIAQMFGLDEITVKSATTSTGIGSSATVAGSTATATAGSGLESTVVAVGKRLSSKLYVSIERSILSVGTVLKLRYQFNRQWSVQTQAGLTNTVDLFYTLSFD